METRRNLPFDKPPDPPPQKTGIMHYQIGDDGGTVIRAGDPGPLNAAGDINVDCGCGNRLIVIPCRGQKGAAMQMTHHLTALIVLCKCGLAVNLTRKIIEIVTAAQKKQTDQEKGGASEE